QAIAAVREEADGWDVGKCGFGVLGPGVKRVYRAGRQAFRAARQQPTAERLHEWRKQTKYLRHQLEVLEPIRPAVLEQLAGQAHERGDLLGDDHDLVVLAEKVREAGNALAILGLIDRRRAQLREEAWPVGFRLFAEKPRVFVKRLAGFWRALRS